LKSVIEMAYIDDDADTQGSPGKAALSGKPGQVTRIKAMTFEILHLTVQIQRWLNRRIAQHLAEQAERLAR
jgi:hypothetical protein